MTLVLVSQHSVEIRFVVLLEKVNKDTCKNPSHSLVSCLLSLVSCLLLSWIVCPQALLHFVGSCSDKSAGK